MFASTNLQRTYRAGTRPIRGAIPRSAAAIRDLAQLAPSQKKTAEAAERTTTAEKEERASSSFVPAAEEEDSSFLVVGRCRHRGSGRRRARRAGRAQLMPRVILLALLNQE